MTGLIEMEILQGFKSEQEASRIQHLLTAFPWVPEPNRQDYLAAAAIYRRCRAGGRTIRSSIDCILAQLCLRHRLPLLTKDRDFTYIADFYPLILVES